MILLAIFGSLEKIGICPKLPTQIFEIALDGSP